MPYESFQSHTPPRNLTIVDVFQQDQIWKYKIQVQLHIPTPAYTIQHQYYVHRRFNEFKQLYQRVRNVVKDEMKVNFPATGLFSFLRANDEALLEERKQQLQLLLEQIEEHPIARHLTGFDQFLEMNSARSKLLGSSYRNMGNCKNSHDDKHQGASKAFVLERSGANSKHECVELR